MHADPASPRRPAFARWIAAAAAVAVLGGLATWLLRSRAAPDDGADVGPVPSERGARPRLVAPAAEGAPRSPTRAGRTPEGALRVSLESLAGETRFQKRLALGALVDRLQGDWREGRLASQDALALLRSARRGFLLLDHFLGYDLAHEATSDHVAGLFRWLTQPARTYQGLSLTTLEPPTGPLGEGARLRLWTSGEEIPRSHLVEAEDLLARLARGIGEEDRGGYDVLATAEMGADLFPAVRGIPWPFAVAGFYTAADDLCVVGTRYPDDFRRILLRHELVHAWQSRLLPDWRSRCLEEGLAEYLSRLEPGDPGVAVPPRRLADEMAALVGLVAALEERGAAFGGLRLADLVAASPAEFYALGPLGYLVALAAVACVGPETVEASLGARSEAQLAQAVGGLSWTDLLAFARSQAGSGDAARAVVIGDLAELPGTEVGGPRPPAPLPSASVLARLGVVLPRGMTSAALDALLAAPRDVAPQEAARLAEVLSWLVADGGLLLAMDATRALDAPFRFAGGPDEGPVRLRPEALDVRSRREFVVALHGELERMRGGRAPVAVALGPEVQQVVPATATLAEPLRVEGLAPWLAAVGPGASLVVVVAAQEGGIAPRGPGEAEESGRVLAYLEALRRTQVRPRAVLVVDLSDGQGSARALADAFAAHFGGRQHVAYWNPQQPLR